MTLAITRRFGRPSWMTPFGHEGFGDVFFDRLWPEWRRDMGEEWSPTVNFFEKEGKYYLTVEVPGMKKDDISVSFDNGCVTISGKKESEKALSIRDALSSKIHKLFESTEQLHDGRWLWIRLLTTSDTDDIKRILQIKRKPKKP